MGEGLQHGGRTRKVHAALLRLEGTRPRHREALRALDAEQRFFVALLRVGLICFTLWVGFWVQFLVSCYYGLVGLNVAMSLFLISDPEYFIPVDAGMGVSLARQFVILAVGGAVLAVGAGWWITRRTPGRWRMRFAVVLFAAIPLAYAMLNQSAEDSTWRGVEAMLERQVALNDDESDAQQREMNQWYIDYYQSLLKRRR